jgi:thiol-disulfide isomerase/thioredoxin
MPLSATGWAVAVGVLAVATVVGLLWRARRGRLTPVRGVLHRASSASPSAADSSLSEADGGRFAADAGPLGADAGPLGADAGPFVANGAQVTLVQFSAPHCAPCARVRAICAELAVDGIRHVEVDADADLAAVQRMHVWRVPTLFVVDASGRPVWRAVGVPDRAELASAVQRVRATAGNAA